jgi:hypothetical protein
MVNNDVSKMMMIVDRTITLRDVFWQVTMADIKSILNRRVMADYSGADFVDKPQETVIKQLATLNFINPVNPKRKLPISIPKDNGRGALVDWTSTHQYGADAFTTICKMSEPQLGYDFYFTQYNDLQLEVYTPANRTMNQSSVPPVVFSDIYDNLEDATFTDSIVEYKNFAYVKPLTDAENEYEVGNTVASGLDRFELYVDSSEAKTIKGAKDYGLARLAEQGERKGFAGTIINSTNSMTTYGKDWFLGDLVTVQSRELQVSTDVQVMEVEELYEGGTSTINVTFGEKVLTIVDVIKNAIKGGN